MLGFQNIEDRTRHGPCPGDMEFPYPSFPSPFLPFPLHPLSSLLFSSLPTPFCLPACLSHAYTVHTHKCTHAVHTHKCAHSVHTHKWAHMHMLPILCHKGGLAASSPTLNLSADWIFLLNTALILLHWQANHGMSSLWWWMVKCKKTGPAP